MSNLLKNIEVVRVENATVAGTSDLAGEVIDMAGWDGVTFIYAIGTLSAGQVTKLIAHQDVASDGSFTALPTAVTSAMSDDDSNKLLILDIYKPTKRYVRPTLDRHTANAVLDSGIAIKYRGSKSPVTQGSTVSQVATVASPAE